MSHKQRGTTPWMRRLNRWYCRFWHRLPNIAHPLPEGPLILAGNHVAGVDPLLVQAVVDRPLTFLMAREYYESMWYFRWMFDAAGAIPVKPGGANKQALSEAIKVLEHGHAICLFPEGEARPKVPMQRLLPGAVVLAVETGAPILPFRVSGVWPFDKERMWRPFLLRGRVNVNFGEPFQLPEGAVGKDSIRHWTEVLRTTLREMK